MPRGYRWCRGRGKGGRGRPCFYRKLSKLPKSRGLIPVDRMGIPSQERASKEATFTPPIYIYLDELEAMRLVDGENLTQDEAGAQMGISRGSIWRLLQSGRKKLITAIFEKLEIRIPFEALEKIDET
ncbi:MAG: DUF134 domain-containing protein [Candidatus Helarchaeota archaeon]|nr:DUF134 domain-containing protein [Candidatus Helarchaeota archaeon]